MKSHIWDHVWLASATVKSNQSIPWNRGLAIWADLNPRISKSPTCRNVFTTKISASPKVKTGFAWNVIASADVCDSLSLVADWVSEPNRRIQRQWWLLIMLCWKMLEGLLGSAPPWGPLTLDFPMGRFNGFQIHQGLWRAVWLCYIWHIHMYVQNITKLNVMSSNI